MARTIDVVVPAGQGESLANELRDDKSVTGLRLQRGASLRPPGDLVTIEVLNSGLPQIMHLLSERGLGAGALSATTSEPLSVVSPDAADAIVRDSSDATWEEMDNLIRRESHMSLNALAVMCVSGVLACAGIATNSLHLVIAAMVIAPGFEPLARVSLGVMASTRAIRQGLIDTGKGYCALLLSAALTAWLLRLLGYEPLPGDRSYLPPGVLATYWSSISAPGVLATAAASVAGGLLIATNRSVLTGGVMIALALIPTAALAAIALVTGAFDTAASAALRWVIDAGLVVLMCGLVFAWKRYRVQKRAMLI